MITSKIQVFPLRIETTLGPSKPARGTYLDFTVLLAYRSKIKIYLFWNLQIS